VLGHEQPEAIGPGRGGGPVPWKARRGVPSGHDLGQLHFPAGGATDRMRAAGLRADGRERCGEARHPAAEIPHAAEDAAHRGERAARLERHLRPAARPAPVAAGQAARGLLLVELLGLVAGAGHAERTPRARKAAKSSSGRPCCRSPHGSSVGNPAVMVSRCLIEIGAASGLTGGQSRSSGTYAPAGSSSPSTPSSRSARTADAVKLLVIDAILKTVAASGAGPPRA